MGMELEKYIRIPFEVYAVQVDLTNVEDIALWCKGTVEMVSTKMMGTETLLPCVKIPGQGTYKGQDFTAYLGHWVVGRNGSFRVYKPNQFKTTFDKAPGATVLFRNSGPSEFYTEDEVEAVWVNNELSKHSSAQEVGEFKVGDAVRVTDTASAWAGWIGFVEDIDGGQIRVRFEEHDTVMSFMADELEAFSTNAAAVAGGLIGG